MQQVDRYSIHLFSDEQDGTYLALCPEFPGVSAFGATREAALAEVRIALELAVETYEDEGWPLPAPDGVPVRENSPAADSKFGFLVHCVLNWRGTWP